MDDTSPEMAARVIEMMQQKTPEERAKMGFSMYEPRPKGRGMIWEEFRTPPKFGCELPGPKGPGFRRPDETSKYLVTHFIRRNNPNISEVDLKKELFLKFYGEDFSVEEQQKIMAHLEAFHTKALA
ncbi:MAG: hypothetical protein KGJ02_06045 [Verrucomicrobiota bacterium]|nr:hypothetical protein [Verrucomicrobiota bacterium]